MATQITRLLRKVDDSQILKKHTDGTTLPYSGPNLTTMLSGVTDPIFVLQRVDANGNAYPYTLQARDQTEFTTDFETTWVLLYNSSSLISILYSYLQFVLCALSDKSHMKLNVLGMIALPLGRDLLGRM